MTDVGCPVCTRGFENQKGLTTHLWRSHPEYDPNTEVSVPCDWCGDTKEMYPSEEAAAEHHFCDWDCRGPWQSANVRGEDHPRYNTVVVDCDWCDGEKEMWKSQAESYDHHFCTDECEYEWRSRLHAGENNPSWRGGYERYYGTEWPRFRRRVAERDGDQCRVCGTTADEVGFSLPVHHLTRVNDYDDPNDAHQMDNALQLCPRCHGLADNDKIIIPCLVSQ